MAIDYPTDYPKSLNKVLKSPVKINIIVNPWTFDFISEPVISSIFLKMNPFVTDPQTSDILDVSDILDMSRPV